jgi:hypothetical protein
MFFHRCLACASPVILAAALSTIGLAQAESGRAANKTGEVDTEHIFGFTEGSDIGEVGEKEAEADSTGRFGRTGGSYSNIATAFEAKFTLAENFRISGAATLAFYDITGVSGLEDRRQGTFQSLSFDARYRLVNREQAPFGLTISIAPRWGFVDEVSGAPAEQYGAEFLLIADRELVPGRLFGAINVSYEPEQTRLRASGETFRESTLGMSAAVSAQVAPGIFIGAEVRNLRHYDGLGLNGFEGQALYVGPTFYMTLSDKIWLSAAWNVQAWGTTAADGGALDLTNFERQNVRLRLGIIF